MVGVPGSVGGDPVGGAWRWSLEVEWMRGKLWEDMLWAHCEFMVVVANLPGSTMSKERRGHKGLCTMNGGWGRGRLLGDKC